MERIARGDLVQVFCAVRPDSPIGPICRHDFDDAEALVDERVSSGLLPLFWVRAGSALDASQLTEAVVGMRLGEQKELCILADDTVAGSRTAGRRLRMTFEVVTVRATSS